MQVKLTHITSLITLVAAIVAALLVHAPNHAVLEFLQPDPTNLLCDSILQSNPAAVAARKFFTLSNGETLEYFDFNHQQQKVVLLIHGVLSDGFMAANFIDVFERLGLRVIAPSLPGWGESTTPLGTESGDISAAAVVSDLMELMDHLLSANGKSNTKKQKEKKFAVASISAGSVYAATVASLHPGRVSKLGLFAPASPFTGAACSAVLHPVKTMLRRVFSLKYVRDFTPFLARTLSVGVMRPLSAKMSVGANISRRAVCKTWKGAAHMSYHLYAADFDGIEFSNIVSGRDDFHDGGDNDAHEGVSEVVIVSNRNDNLHEPEMQQCLHSLISSGVGSDGDNKRQQQQRVKLIEREGLTHMDAMKSEWMEENLKLIV